jgi:hypothetical protein
VTLEERLKDFLATHGAVAGTVHQLHGDMLELAAAVNIPPPVVEKTRHIPRGKGMAGLAWERGQVVSTCNLQTDTTGDVRPGAKAVGAQAALAIPVHDTGGRLTAVVGLAFLGDRDFSEADLARYRAAAEAFAHGSDPR